MNPQVMYAGRKLDPNFIPGLAGQLKPCIKALRRAKLKREISGTSAKPDSATRMLNGVANVYRNIHTSTAQSTVVDNVNSEDNDFLQAVDEADQQLTETLEEHMNDMESSETPARNSLDDDSCNDSDNEAVLASDTQPMCLRDLRTDGWAQIKNMGIVTTKKNEEERKVRKVKLSKKILSHVKEMKNESAGNLKMELAPTRVPSWRRYTRHLRKI